MSAKNVIVHPLGGEKSVHDDVRTVGEVKKKLKLENHTATVNGETQADGYELDDGDFVSLAQAVKGGIFGRIGKPSMSYRYLRFVQSHC